MPVQLLNDRNLPYPDTMQALNKLAGISLAIALLVGASISISLV
jgi:hypothetical protein